LEKLLLELNPEKDVSIDVGSLTEEFKKLPLLLYRYSILKAEAGEKLDVEESLLKEVRSELFKSIMQQHEKKPSDKVFEAEIEAHPAVVAQKRKVFRVKKDFETIKGYVESVKAKKDMLIQIGADLRKEQ
jgi:hypothetical protein